MRRKDPNSLNKREKAILKFIEKQVNANGYPPSVREIGKAVGLKSTATVHGYLESLEKKGYVKKESQKGRTLKLLKGGNLEGEQTSFDKSVYTNKEMVNVPVVGKITAGAPILAVENGKLYAYCKRREYDRSWYIRWRLYISSQTKYSYKWRNSSSFNRR